MTLKDITPYIFGEFIVNVEDATDEQFEYVDDFLSSNKEKMEKYKDAKVENVMPHDMDCVQVNVCINY